MEKKEEKLSEYPYSKYQTLESLPGEEWRRIPSHSEYWASSIGRIATAIPMGVGFRSWNWRIRKQGIGKLCHYPTVGIVIKGKSHPRLVHRLVAEAFLGHCPPGKEVSHIDGNRTNASPTNLIYESRSANHRRKLVHGTHLRGERSPNAKLTKDDVARIRESSLPQKLLANKFNVSQSNIHHVRSRATWND